MRLLHLHPSQDFEALIHATLVTIDFSNGPYYKALSYAWGAPTFLSNILLDGVEFKATPNLVSMLRHIRTECDTQVLWVDAVCINQLDTHERNHQVQIMARIYQSATEVIAWLGESGDGSDSALKLLNRCGTALAAHELHTPHDLLPIHDFEWLLSAVEDLYDERAWKAIPHLYKRPYWNRLWIAQEFVLTRKVVLQCGFECFDATHLFADYFFSAWENSLPDPYGMSLLSNFNEVHSERVSIFKLVEWRLTRDEDARWRILDLLCDLFFVFVLTRGTTCLVLLDFAPRVRHKLKSTTR